MVITGYRGLYMVIHGYSWLLVVIHGFTWLYMVVSQLRRCSKVPHVVYTIDKPQLPGVYLDKPQAMQVQQLSSCQKINQNKH